MIFRKRIGETSLAENITTNMQNLSFSTTKQVAKIGLCLVGATLINVFNAQSARSFSVTIESPTSQVSTKSDIFTIDFDDSGASEIDTLVEDSVSNAGTTYTYSNFDNTGNNEYSIPVADQFGGANGSGRYISNSPASGPNSQSRYTISIDQDQEYFGFWWSAGDVGNTIEFFNDGASVFTFDTSDILGLIPNSSGSTITSIDGSTTYNTPDFYGNPTTPFLGNNNGEPYAFVNFYADSGQAFDRIDLYQPDGGGQFESDNHTFSAIAQSPFANSEITVPFEFSPGLGLLVSGAGLFGLKIAKRKKSANKLEL